MYLLLRRILRHDAVHEIKKLTATTTIVMPGSHHSRCTLQCSKQRCRSVSFVAVVKSSQCPSVGKSKIALRPFQSLNGRFLIDTKHYRVFWRCQVQPNNVCRLGSKRGISTDIPAVPTHTVDDVIDIGAIYEGKGVESPGQDVPGITIGREGWDATAHTEEDVLSTISARQLERAGQAATLALMALARDTSYAPEGKSEFVSPTAPELRFIQAFFGKVFREARE